MLEARSAGRIGLGRLKDRGRAPARAQSFAARFARRPSTRPAARSGPARLSRMRISRGAPRPLPTHNPHTPSSAAPPRALSTALCTIRA